MFLLLFSFFAQAAPLEWGDLEVGAKVELEQRVVFSKSMQYAPASPFRVLKVEGLNAPGAPVVYFELWAEPCTHSDWASEMVLVQPKSAGDIDRRVGIELAGCLWKIWVEPQDYYYPGIFGAK